LTIRARVKSSRAGDAGSLRDRQDYLMAEHGGTLRRREPIPTAMEQFALARLRQLAAHEVGHTLGLAHNYISSTMNRASVMDYPHPWITIKPDGTIDLARAYAVGIGEWDKIASSMGIRISKGTKNRHNWTNSCVTPSSESIFLTDQDAVRPAAHTCNSSLGQWCRCCR